MDHRQILLAQSFYDDPSSIPLEHQLNDLARFRELDSAVRQGQMEIVEKLLQQGTPVNLGRMFCELRTPLLSSVYLGDLRVVQKLLQHGASVNARYCGDTPLTLAVKFERYEIADILLQSSGLENCSNSEGITHFHIACMRGQVDVAKKLLQCKKDVEKAVDINSDYWAGYTSLHFAVKFQHIVVVEFLLSLGTSIIIKDGHQHTPLHLAHMLRNERIIDMILVAHEEVFDNPVDSKGLSHFHIACTRNNPNMVEHFLTLNVELEDSLSDGAFYWKRKKALDLAIYYECVDVIKSLLHHGAHKRSFSGDEFDFIKNAHCTGNSEIVDLLSINENLRTKSKCTKNNTKNGGSPSVRNPLVEVPNFSNWTTSSNRCTPLISGIKRGMMKYVKSILSMSFKESPPFPYNIQDFTEQDVDGKSPLHLAFERDLDEIMILMLNNHKNFNKNSVDNNGLSHLHIACAKNDVKTIQHLLNHGADVDSCVHSNASFWPGFSPLHFAAKFGSVKATQTLLEKGANYTIKNASNFTAFDIAMTQTNQVDIEIFAFGVMKTILTFHSRCKSPSFNDRGVSPLHLACFAPYSYGSPFHEMIELLKHHPNDINKASHKMGTRWDGFTPFHFAIDEKNHRNAILLKNAGADIFMQDADGDTAFHLRTEVTEELEFQFDPLDDRYFELNHRGSCGNSIFLRACNDGNIELMEYFLERGVDPDYPSIHVGTGCIDKAPLHSVICNNPDQSLDAVQLLLVNGADPNVRDYRNNTPLHFIYHTEFPEIIGSLVREGADINARNSLYETPLIRLCKELSILDEDPMESLPMLLNHGADITLADERNLTPLSIVCEKDSLYPSEPGNTPGDIETLLEHLRKLEILGVDMSRAISAGDEISQRFYSRRINSVKDGKFKSQCISEIEIMKQIHTDNYTTLYDILFKSSTQLAVLSQNDLFRQVIYAEDFHTKFPNYGFMLKSRLTQGELRWPLLKKSRKKLNSILGIVLPQDCVENILQYLDNQDLKNIIESRKII
ncbi:hypothetical protein QAD02_009563 [Eretmocerus hayati]|uniref:Uncharacterized protein n=1 Tax=Eretmocerus hayati TaxID=131215 RepID=A0ACC2N9Q1_9HYME|nr:hypothetical protein QAD02_009563 [Eretmocerus hayati]